MTRDRDRNSMWAMLGSVGGPCSSDWLPCTLFYAALHQGLLGTEFFPRYCAAHPILYCEVGLFFVGVAALLLKAGRSPSQLAHDARRSELETSRSGTIPVEQCGEMLEELERPAGRVPAARISGAACARRWRIVERKGSADGLDDELKYLSELDEVAPARQLWLGADRHLGDSHAGIPWERSSGSPRRWGTSIRSCWRPTSRQAMEGLMAGLYVAFDTTSLALSLSMVLMFVQFFAERWRLQLLSIVDARAAEELRGSFRDGGHVA